MRKSLLLAVCAVSIAVALSAQAIEIKKPEVGALKNVTSAVSGAAQSLTPTAVRGTIAGINEKLEAADDTVRASFESLVSALSSKEKAAEIKAELNAINENKDLSAAEKSAKVTAVISDYGDSLKEKQAENGEKLKKASDAQKTQVANAVVDLAVASYQYLDIANDCGSVVRSVATNPTLAVQLSTELASLKDTTVILKNNVKSIKNVTTQAVAVAKAGGVEIKIPKPTKSKASKVDLTKTK